jgi:hypothetical protein
MRLNLGSFLYPGLQEMVQPSISHGQYVDVIRKITSSWKGLTGTTIHVLTTISNIIFKHSN